MNAYLDRSTASQIRAAAASVAARHGLAPDWLNDAVKGFIATAPDIDLWAEYPGLRVNAVTPAYMFAMKAVAARPADIDDLKVLAGRLGIDSSEAGLEVVTAHVPERLLTPRTRYLLETLFDVDTR